MRNHTHEHEKVNKKLKSKSLSLIFNKICRRENLPLTYIHTYRRTRTCVHTHTHTHTICIYHNIHYFQKSSIRQFFFMFWRKLFHRISQRRRYLNWVGCNYTRRLRAILNKSWRQHPTKHQLYSHQPPITKTIQVRRTRHAGHCWRSRNELISDVLLWTPTYGRAKAGPQAWTYSSYVRMRDVVLKTCQRRWTIRKCGERGSGISVLAAPHDDDDIYKVKWATLVEVDPKAPFSIATTPRCMRGCHSFPWIASLYPWNISYNTEC